MNTFEGMIDKYMTYEYEHILKLKTSENLKAGCTLVSHKRRPEDAGRGEDSGEDAGRAEPFRQLCE